jgi:hypothetical protein
MALFKPRYISVREKTDQYFQKEIQAAQKKLTAFKTSSLQKTSLSLLRRQFIS